MTRLPGVEGFNWDEANLAKNWEKHRVTPWECEQVFFNLPLVVADDLAHSTASLDITCWDRLMPDAACLSSSPSVDGASALFQPEI